MKIHAITTGHVRLTRRWCEGRVGDPLRLARTMLDREFTGWLPIWCWVIEHPEGLILIDTGRAVDANRPNWFPPWMRLVQRAAVFDEMAAEQEIGPMLRSRGLAPGDIRWVILTHLHGDHADGLRHFPKAEVLIAAAEWSAATGMGGRMQGYQNQRWPTSLSPRLIAFADGQFRGFPRHHILTRREDVRLVPTPGHSAGHLSVILEEDERLICFAGDVSYTQRLMLEGEIDGVALSPKDAWQSVLRMRQLVQALPTVYLPSHDPDAARRLEQREIVGGDASAIRYLQEAMSR
ncbi:MAG TPA: N-acyl homoserine lactonase family protein [Gemmatimonadales bacterium]|nr:N-acyl homoserine lactonase family protein [Gemmatimonadales bacterium]